MYAYPRLDDVGSVGSAGAPSISVVIPTRNRDVPVVRALESVIGAGHAGQAGPELNFEVIIVDQSDDDSTRLAVAPYLGLPHIRYVRTAPKGVGAARNAGAAAARSEWIAFTDDDCTVQGNWLEELRRAFEMDARIGMIFGNVIAGPHDRDSGFVLSYVRSGSSTARSLAQKHTIEGIAACMAVRKSVWVKLNGFDPLLGTGTRFHAGEELDFAIRTLEAGYWVYETDQAEVVHWGFRRHSEKSAVAYHYAFGIGAVYLKHLKCWQWRVLLPLLQLASRWAFSRPRASYGLPPGRMARLKGFVNGAVAGWRTPVDGSAVLYQSRKGA